MSELKVLLFCVLNLSLCALVKSDGVPEYDNISLRSLIKRVQRLEENEHALKVDIGILNADNVALNIKVDKLNSRLNDQERTIEILPAKLLVQEQKSAKFESALQVLATSQSESRNTETYKNDTKKPDIDTAIDGIETKKSSNIITTSEESDTTFAFFATLSKHLMHARPEQSIAFDNVVTNVGNAYNNQIGVFKAPVYGVYVFSVTLMGYEHGDAHYAVQRNKVTVSLIYVRGTEAIDPVSSQTFVLELQQGDSVFVSNINPDESLFGLNYTTFAGFLLQDNQG